MEAFWWPKFGMIVPLFIFLVFKRERKETIFEGYLYLNNNFKINSKSSPEDKFSDIFSVTSSSYGWMYPSSVIFSSDERRILVTARCILNASYAWSISMQSSSSEALLVRVVHRRPFNGRACFNLRVSPGLHVTPCFSGLYVEIELRWKSDDKSRIPESPSENAPTCVQTVRVTKTPLSILPRTRQIFPSNQRMINSEIKSMQIKVFFLIASTSIIENF